MDEDEEFAFSDETYDYYQQPEKLLNKVKFQQKLTETVLFQLIFNLNVKIDENNAKKLLEEVLIIEETPELFIDVEEEKIDDWVFIKDSLREDDILNTSFVNLTKSNVKDIN